MIDADINNKKIDSLGIVGAGSWGTALAHHFATQGLRVTLWARSPHITESIYKTRCNETYLPGITLHKNVMPTSNLKDLKPYPLLILTVPAQSVRDVLTKMHHQELLHSQQSLIITSKGIEQKTHLFMSQVVSDLNLSMPLAVLSGPSFALEVAQGLPTRVVLACHDSSHWQPLIFSLHSTQLTLCSSSDIIGLQVCGAFKNIIAIGAGILYGLGFGENAQAIFVTKGFQEMRALTLALSGQEETCLSWGGLADLILTALSKTSRNTRMGVHLAQLAHDSFHENHTPPPQTIEGAHSAQSILWHAKQHNLDLPLVKNIAQALHKKDRASYEAIF